MITKPMNKFQKVFTKDRLPTVKFEGFTSFRQPVQEFDPDDDYDVRWWKNNVNWWLEPLPEPEPIKTIDKDWIFEIIDQTKEYTKCLITDHFNRNQPFPHPSVEDIEKAAMKWGDERYFSHNPTPTIWEAYQAGAIAVRDGRIQVRET